MWVLDSDAARLFRELDATDDDVRREELCNKIIVVAIPIADRLARRYHRSAVPLEDLQQVARAALVQAARRFKGGGEQAFLGFVVPSVVGELKRYFRDCGWTIRPPRRIQEARTPVRQAREALLTELGREPTTVELAATAGVPVETVHDVHIAAQRCWPDSLDRPQRDDDGSGTLADTLGVTDPGLQQADARLLVEAALRGLDQREREVIYLRYYQGRSQREVGQQLGVTQMQVSRIEAAAMQRLRESMGARVEDAA